MPVLWRASSRCGIRARLCRWAYCGTRFEIAERYYEFAKSGLLAFSHGDESLIIDSVAEIILQHCSPVSLVKEGEHGK
jgi:hypothetical protein